MQKEDVKKTVYLYGLTKLLYSLLVVADYYATTEFMNGAWMLDFGEIGDYEDMIDIYESGDVQKKIREYEKETYPMEKEKLEKIDEINILRDRISCSTVYIQTGISLLTWRKYINSAVLGIKAPAATGCYIAVQ